MVTWGGGGGAREDGGGVGRMEERGGRRGEEERVERREREVVASEEGSCCRWSIRSLIGTRVICMGDSTADPCGGSEIGDGVESDCTPLVRVEEIGWVVGGTCVVCETCEGVRGVIVTSDDGDDTPAIFGDDAEV